MQAIARKCLLLALAGAAIFGALSVFGVPGSRILIFAPLLLCGGMHVLMGHGSHDGHRGHGEDSE